jgi:F-type H+-transporting ATPase subunit a
MVVLALVPAVFAPVVRAQEPAAQAHSPEATVNAADLIMPHITDSKFLDYPCFKSMSEWACELELPSWPVTIAGKTFDLGLTKHVVFMMIAAALCLILLIGAARSHARASSRIGRPKGFAAGLEAIILYLRNEIYIPVLGGHGSSAYIPFCLTLFFFILFCNVLGLIPWGSTATGNISVTATLAIITFITIEAAGIKSLGAGYLGTVIYWPHDMPFLMKFPLTFILTPVELVGKFTKPFALTIRLFANMLAGHVIILGLIGMIFMFGFGVAIAPVALALFIMVIEVMVAVVQAFLFSLLAAVFIGQIRSAHH